MAIWRRWVNRKELRTLISLLILVFLPMALCLVNPERMYAPLYRDGWLYHGYYIDLPGHLRAFADLYYSSRLSMTLPGWLVYQVFPESMANHVFHLGIYLLGCIGLYSLVRKTISERAALLASILLGSHSFFTLAVTSDYFDGIGIGYLLLAYALCVKAKESRRKRTFFYLSGVVVGLLVISNLMMGIMLLGYLGFHYILCKNVSELAYPKQLFWIVGGGCTTLIILGIFSKVCGGPFFILWPSLRFAVAFELKGSNPFRESVATWLPQASWLVMPVVVSAGAIWYLVTKRGIHIPKDKHDIAKWYQIQLLGMVFLLVLMESTGRHNLLQIWFYASAILVPLAYLAIAAQWNSSLESLTAVRYWGVVVLAGSSVILFGVNLKFIQGIPIVLVLIPMLLGVMLIQSTRVQFNAICMGIVVWSISDALLIQDFSPAKSLGPRIAEELHLKNENRISSRRANIHSSIHSAMKTIQKWDPNYSGYFWYDIDEPNGLIFDQIACLHCWGHRLINTQYPSLKNARYTIRSNMKFIILTTDEQTFEQAKVGLGDLGLRVSVKKTRNIRIDDRHFSIYYVDTRLLVEEKKTVFASKEGGRQ